MGFAVRNVVLGPRQRVWPILRITYGSLEVQTIFVHCVATPVSAAQPYSALGIRKAHFMFRLVLLSATWFVSQVLRSSS